jgi:hypothetical protein
MTKTTLMKPTVRGVQMIMNKEILHLYFPIKELLYVIVMNNILPNKGLVLVRVHQQGRRNKRHIQSCPSLPRRK